MFSQNLFFSEEYFFFIDLLFIFTFLYTTESEDENKQKKKNADENKNKYAREIEFHSHHKNPTKKYLQFNFQLEKSEIQFKIPAKNQGIAISKNSTTTSIQHEHKPHGTSQSSQSTRYNVESTSINGFQTNKNDLDIAMLQILDPHLRPVPPAMDSSSQKIYDDHMKLAQEYFKVNF